MTIGFIHSRSEMQRRAVYGPGTGRKLGYFATDDKGRQFAQNIEGRTIARILRWKNGTNPCTDSHACGGYFLPAVYE